MAKLTLVCVTVLLITGMKYGEQFLEYAIAQEQVNQMIEAQAKKHKAIDQYNL